MTPPALTTMLRLSPAVLAALLVACGDDGNAEATNPSGNNTSSATETSTPTGVSDSDNTPTTTGSASGVSQSGSSDGTDTSADDTSATSVSTTASDTTNPETTNPETTNPETTNPETTNPETTNPETTSPETTGVDPDTTNGDDTTTSDDTTGGFIEPCACADVEVPLDDGVFVLSDNAQLWKFFPEDYSFSMLGSFSCNGNTSSFSMAVDRLGYAWVMFQDGTIGKVDVTSPNICLPSGYNTNQMGVNLFGMGFVSNSQADQCDSLFGNTFSGGGFSEGPGQGTFLNMKTEDLLIKKLGPTTFNGAEVSGTGDGRVFLFGGVGPSKLVEVDRTNGAYIDVLPLVGVETTQGFAFAHFDGDFYIFTESDDPFDAVSKVTHVDYDDSDMNGKKDITQVVMKAPIRIVGAGVSTCAPFAPQ